MRIGLQTVTFCFFDGKTTIPCDFSLHQKKGKKETKLYLGLGGYQGCDFNGQIADATLCYLTYTIIALEKRFTEYQTIDELFSDIEDDFIALTLWKKVLACIEHILRVLGETLGVTPQHLMATISGNNKAMYKIFVMAETLEKIG